MNIVTSYCVKQGILVKLVITPPCHGGGHGFEPRRSRKRKSHSNGWLFSFISSSHQAQNRNSFSVPYAEPLLPYVGEICIVALPPAVPEDHVKVGLRQVVVIGGYVALQVCDPVVVPCKSILFSMVKKMLLLPQRRGHLLWRPLTSLLLSFLCWLFCSSSHVPGEVVCVEVLL